VVLEKRGGRHGFVGGELHLLVTHAVTVAGEVLR
jgi:hypothetical protein